MAVGTLVKTLTGEMGTTSPVMVNPISFVGDNAYPTGGTVAFQAKIQALFQDHRELVCVVAGNCGIYRPVYDKANDKLLVYSGGAEVTAATDLSGTTFNITAFTV